jgi:hypothetical protein
MKILSKFFAIVLASFFFVTNSLCARESIALVTISTPNRVSFSQYMLTSLSQRLSVTMLKINKVRGIGWWVEELHGF